MRSREGMKKNKRLSRIITHWRIQPNDLLRDLRGFACGMVFNVVN